MAIPSFDPTAYALPDAAPNAPAAAPDYRAMAAAAAQRHGIPPALFKALVNTESRFNPTARSPVGAYGLAQLMPGTAKDLGIDPSDPEQNLEGGARYLRQMYDRYGDWRLALAAYNAGPGRVDQYKGVPPFRETQEYVRRILGDEGVEVAQNTTQANDASPAEPLTRQQMLRRELLRREAERRGIELPSATPQAPDALAPFRPQVPPDQRREAIISEAVNRYVTENPNMALLATSAKGMPFVGEYVDDLVGQIATLTGESPDAAALQADLVRRIQSRYTEENPTAALTGQIGLGVLTSLPFAFATPSALGRLAPGVLRTLNAGSPVAKAVTSAGLLGALSGFEGFVSGLGEDEAGLRPKNWDAAKQRALVSTLLGGAIGAAAPSVMQLSGKAWEGLRMVATMRKQDATGIIASTLGVSKPAAAFIRKALEAEDLDAARAALRRAMPDSMLADTGPAAMQALDTALQTAGIPATAREAIKGRIRTAGANLTDALDSTLGRPRGPREVAREIRDGTAQERRDAFDAAFRTPINYADNSGLEVERIINLVPPERMQAAVRRANDEIAIEQMSNPAFRERAIKINVGDDGRITFEEMPTVRQLHHLKRGFQMEAEAGKDPVTGKLSPDAVMAGKYADQIRRLLINTTGGPDGTYAVAMRLGGDRIRLDNAADLGRRLLSRRVTREEAAEAVQGMSPAELRRVREGVRATIDETMANVRRTMTDPNVDVRQVTQVVKDLSSQANREKLRAILPRAEYVRLMRGLERAAAATDLQAAVIRNSATAVRQSGRDAMRAEMQPNLMTEIVTGNPLEATAAIGRRLTAQDPRALSDAEIEAFREVAQALTLIRGDEANRAYQAVMRAIEGQPLRDAMRDQIARVITTGLGFSAYEGGKSLVAPGSGFFPGLEAP